MVHKRGGIHRIISLWRLLIKLIITNISDNLLPESGMPKAGGIFWCYDPDKGSITITGPEPHPEDKANG
jgi:hypothetical protein